MIRYIDLTDQIIEDEFMFAWFDTVVDAFVTYCGESTWQCWEDFERDVREAGDETMIERYKGLFCQNERTAKR